ncbi:MAG TPA: DUF4129 domain-containing protein [Thermoplasmata archaeon]|nr:DUF4129 domain-containing protein [Thermoplasmata archaeon]
MAPPWRTSPILLCVVAIALAGGAAASLVSRAAPPAGAGTVSGGGITISTTLLGLLLILPFAAALGSMIFSRVRDGGVRMPKGIVAFAFVFLAIMVVFAVLGGYLNPGTVGVGPGSTGSGSGGHGNGSGGGNTSGGGGTGTAGLPSVPSVPLPSGVFLVLAAVVALAIVGVAVPAAWGAVAARRGRRGAAEPTVVSSSVVGSALARAAADLDAGNDPRAVIERLYAQILERVVQVAGDVSGRTPEEIRSDQLLPLGVRPTAAEQLTRLFEEARYSTHALGPDAAARARAAVGAAAADLARVPAPR